MKKFILRTLLFLSPFLIIEIAQGFLPIYTFTNRFYEASLYKSSIIPHNFPLYANQKGETTGYGDLRFNTKYEVAKKEDFITDELGFRNNKFIKHPDILIIGDSFTMGATNGQSQTLANQIMEQSNQKYSVYAMSPVDFSILDKMLKLNIIEKPKYIIYQRVERGEIPKLEYFQNSFSDKLRYEYNNLWTIGNTNVFLDKVFRAYVNNYAKARITNSKGAGTQSKIEENMFFYDPKHINPSEEWMNLNVKSLESYKRYSDSIGSQFIYLPMPNKETVYFEKIPVEKQPDYLFRIGNTLKQKNINYYPTIEFYNNFRKKDNRLLYHSDDSHWNGLASELIAVEIIKYLENLEKK
ncbi:MAG: hypothetical protein DI529_15615 [Chryseobacterium sp.]|nr:MAG: hypothetical protein DI529_15615 [Chryseobacterium sp.]